eukprot:391012_1
MGNKGSQEAFDPLKTVDLPVSSSYSQPVCITQNNRQLIFIMPTRTQKYIKYDVESDKFLDAQKYPESTHKLFAHSSTTDTAHRYIYILDGKNQLFMILDAKKVDNPWRVYKDFSVKCSLFPSVCYVPQPFDEFHVISAGKHLVWNQSKKDFVQIFNIGQKLQHSAFIYVASKRQLILMGGIIRASTHSTYVDSIYVAKYSNIDEQWKWNHLKQMKLPHKMAKFGYVLYQDRYIILFGGEIAEKTFLNTIYILDVYNYAISSIYEWIPVDQICPEKNIYFAVQNKNKIHLFQRGGYNHWVIDMFTNQFTLRERSLTMTNVINDEKTDSVIVTELQSEINSKNETIKILEDQLKCLQDEMKNEKEKNKIYRQQMEEKCRKLSAKLVSTSLYSDWDSEQVLYWIFSLENGKFNRYKDKLTKALRTTTGADLSQVVNVYPIKMWGITDVNEQNCLLNHIRLLCEQKKAYSDNVEGAHGDILNIKTVK